MKVLKRMFCNSDGKFQPTYLWVTLLMVLVVTSFIMKLVDASRLSDTAFIGILGFVVAWLSIYNFQKVKNGK